MPTPVRVRFAPSPTGFLHVGSGHSALANWLFARHNDGAFLLRIEDTDAERNRPELIDNVLEMLHWLGLEWDGEPVHQSDRGDLYLDAAAGLVAAGTAYHCECTGEEVQARNKAAGGKPGYDGFCRDRGLGPGPGRAVRFRTPREGRTGWTDLVRGEISFANADVEDFVVVRGNGAPMFLLANSFDDADMGITHVIRGEDHVNSTPKYLLLLEAIGLAAPQAFAHMPLLVNEQRKKLSKRRDDVSMADYRDRGYLPEAMVNYLALLGWGPADGVEIRPISEIVDLYRLEDVNASPAFFDPKKLSHVNAEKIRGLDTEAFLAAADPFLTLGDPARHALASLATEVQERVRTLAEVEPMIEFLVVDEPAVDEDSWTKVITKGRNVAEMLDASVAALDALAGQGPDAWVPEALQAAVSQAAVVAGLVNAEGAPQLSKAQGPVRLAISGRSVGPPLWESLAVLGSDRTLAPLGAAPAPPGLMGPPSPPVARRWRRRLRWTSLVGLGVAVLVVSYVATTFVLVWQASRHDGRVPADAIVVLGAAQYDGRPSPVLQARLDHALDLYEEGLAPLVVVTGGRQQGDRYTEATAGYNYLRAHGLPDEAIRKEVQGASTYESLASVARFLREEGIGDVLLVSSPAHSRRVADIAREVGLRATVSPAAGSPSLQSLARETAAVSVGRLVGYRRLDHLGR